MRDGILENRLGLDSICKYNVEKICALIGWTLSLFIYFYSKFGIYSNRHVNITSIQSYTVTDAL